MGIGKVQFYAAFGLLVGVWGNEASSSGFIAWAEVALRIKVFWVFSFGASVKAIFEQLGPQEPNYRRVSLEVRIETPWWLPDVTFRVERVRDTPQPETMPVLSGAARDGGSAGAGRGDRDRRRNDDDRARRLGAHDRRAAGAALRADRGVGVGRAGSGERRFDDRTQLRRLGGKRDDGRAEHRRRCRAPGRDSACAEPAQLDLHDHPDRHQATGPLRTRRRECGPICSLPADSEIGGLDDLLDDPDLGVTFASAVRFRWDADVIVDDTRRPAPAAGQRRHPVLLPDRQPGDRGRPAGDRSLVPVLLGQAQIRVRIVLDFDGMPLGRPRACGADASATAPAPCAGCCRGRPWSPAPSGQPSGVPVARVLHLQLDRSRDRRRDLRRAGVRHRHQRLLEPGARARPGQRARGGGVPRARGGRPSGVPAVEQQPCRPDPLLRRAGTHVGDAAISPCGRRRRHDRAVGRVAGNPQPALPNGARRARPASPTRVGARPRAGSPAAASSPGCPTTTTS